VAVDAAGNLYIADTGNFRVRKVSAATGVITTVAGNGTEGYSGDGGAATSAEVSLLGGLAVDAAGNLYIADEGNSCIREVMASTGVITTVAGNGTPGYSGDGGPAVSAALSYPSGVAVDGAGNLFIADTGNNRVREVSASNGVITTVAGNGIADFSGDGGNATSAALYGPQGVAVDSTGNLFIADTFNSRIRKVSASTEVITTVAGNGTFGYSGDGGPAPLAALYNPQGVAVDAAGNLFIADTQNNRVREVIAAPDRLAFAEPSSTPAGTPFTITVTAQDLGTNPVTGYTGTVHFTATNGTMAQYTFTPADMGSRPFTITLTHAMTLTVTGTDTAVPPVTGSTTFTITPAAPDHIALSLPGTIQAGVPFALTVTVQDAYGNTVTGYSGTVHFALMGPVMSTAQYTFRAADITGPIRAKWTVPE
jgi:sugar lactone lactonase YvrE